VASTTIQASVWKQTIGVQVPNLRAQASRVNSENEGGGRTLKELCTQEERFFEVGDTAFRKQRDKKNNS